ncbi:hypothetical protein BH09CHL1_BH09CHL1_15830 [soil metagenome]
MKRSHSRVLVFGTIFTLLLSMLGAISPARADENSNIVIKVRSYTCDAELDGAKASLADLTENCTDPAKGLKLTYYTSDGQPQNTNLDNYGGIDFVQFPVGNAKLLLGTPKGYESRVFCSLIPGTPPAETPTVTPDPATPSADGSMQPTTESGDNSGTGGGNGAEDGNPVVVKLVSGYGYTEFKNPVEQQLAKGDEWNCSFFNIVVKDSNASSVTLNVFNCPAIEEKDKADPKYLDSYCSKKGTDGIIFELTDSDQNRFTKVVKDGYVLFTNIYPEDGIKLKETFPAGYDNAVVYCNPKAGTDQPPGYEPYAFEGGYIAIKGSKGYNIACNWYNLPAAAASVKITKYACPIGVKPPSGDTKKSNDQLECTPQTGVDFTLTTSGAPGEIKQSTGKDGQIIWDRVAPGDVQIVETLPKGYAYPVVYCTIGLVEDQPTSNEIKVAYGDYAPTITFKLAAGANADCAWYNLEQSPSAPTPTRPTGGNPTPVPTYTATPNPNDPASFTIYTFICELDYDLYDGSATPENDCEPAESDIEFEIENASGDVTSASTDSYGTASFTSLKPGTYTLTELFPNDVTSAFIADCESNLRSFTDNPFIPLNRLDADGHLGVDLRAGEKLSCDLYNVPSHSSSSSSGATVSITLLDCPGQTASPEQCSPVSSGTQFTLIPNGDNGEEVTLTTDDSGVASGAVSPGAYEVEQLGHDECFADSTAFDSNGDLIVSNESVDVTLYNCGE